LFYITEIKDHIRVPPRYFELDVMQAILKCIKAKYEGYIDPEIGIVVDVSEVSHIGEGVVIHGDGASYYETVFHVITFRPELQEVCVGRIRDIADFGAFINLGPIDGMIHISQTMDDFVSFAKDKVLSGKESNRALKVGDKCRARTIAVSFKDVTNPKMGLTMRQPFLGKLEWIEEENEKASKKTEAKKPEAKKSEAKKPEAKKPEAKK